LEDHGRCFL